MVQGHTVDVLLGDEFRVMSNPFFAFWFNNRGMTAPIFLFTAGTTFTYLFRLHKEPFKKNPRVMRGIQRVLLLIGLGYLLRYPTPYVFYFKDVGIQQWNIFFAVDVLQLIGFGLLFILLAFYISDKIKISDFIIFPIFMGINILGYALFENINWKEFL
ncbi:MAG: heparan-alpha-glucosaminide N-acetyltransferase domain-containing protein, partial [Ignavibacteriaceae bacterium]|nr:heparan-alpha-glucosaminide N-acetyltransferase domain-containing protein [Ignavibacteriaceae bacterium]